MNGVRPVKANRENARTATGRGVSTFARMVRVAYRLLAIGSPLVASYGILHLLAFLALDGRGGFNPHPWHGSALFAYTGLAGSVFAVGLGFMILSPFYLLAGMISVAYGARCYKRRFANAYSYFPSLLATASIFICLVCVSILGCFSTSYHDDGPRFTEGLYYELGVPGCFWASFATIPLTLIASCFARRFAIPLLLQIPVFLFASGVYAVTTGLYLRMLL